MKTTSFTIGQLARAAEVNVETVRYYQRIGLLKEPEKPAQGYRQYPREIAARIRFIKRMQRLGFRLREIAELLSLSEGQCPDVRARAEQKRRRIEARIQDLAAMRATLDDLIDACRTGPSAQACQILATLGGRIARLARHHSPQGKP